MPGWVGKTKKKKKEWKRKKERIERNQMKG